MQPTPEHSPDITEQAAQLSRILSNFNDARVVVVGPSCCGKSTLVERIPGAVDMDKVLFTQLSDEETQYVCQDPWTPEIGQVMSRLARERIQVEPGRPVFSTVVLDADVVIYLATSEDLLAERASKRGVNIDNVRGMLAQIEQHLESGSLPVVRFWLG